MSDELTKRINAARALVSDYDDKDSAGHQALLDYIAELEADCHRLTADLAERTRERDEHKKWQAAFAERLGNQNAWTCPQCGSCAWSYDTPECDTRWCDDCGHHMNPGDPGYPLDRIEELEADLADARREIERRDRLIAAMHRASCHDSTAADSALAGKLYADYTGTTPGKGTK